MATEVEEVGAVAGASAAAVVAVAVVAVAAAVVAAVAAQVQVAVGLPLPGHHLVHIARDMGEPLGLRPTVAPQAQMPVVRSGDWPQECRSRWNSLANYLLLHLRSVSSTPWQPAHAFWPVG